MFIAERLTLARQRRGLTKSGLAERANLASRSISSYESSRAEPRRSTVTTLAEVLSFPESFFDAPAPVAIPHDGASFRSLARMTASQRDTALAAGRLCVDLNRWLTERFELPEADLPQANLAITDPEGAALLTRTHWGLGTAPIPNMIHLVESHGVRVFSLAEECHEVDAFSFWSDGVAMMCLNTMKTAEHSVFDVAHELGHLVLHRGHGSPRGREEEQEANAFAASFLMPRSDVLAAAPRFPGLTDLAEAKGRWRVSTAALNYRMHKLGLLSDWHYREICIELGRRGRARELNPIQRESSQLLEKAFAALRSEGVRRGDVAAALYLYPADLDTLVFGLVMSSLDGGGQRVGRAGHSPDLSVVV
jgi:Zn-dependent peptidase ImmA (M78 family)/transcriptional regulator with XRE-family HTH domain